MAGTERSAESLRLRATLASIAPGTALRDGLERILRLYGDNIVWQNLLPIGASRRNWRNTLVSDGFLMVRHPDLAMTTQMSDDIGESLQLHAE